MMSVGILSKSRISQFFASRYFRNAVDRMNKAYYTMVSPDSFRYRLGVFVLQIEWGVYSQIFFSRVLWSLLHSSLGFGGPSHRVVWCAKRPSQRACACYQCLPSWVLPVGRVCQTGGVSPMVFECRRSVPSMGRLVWQSGCVIVLFLAGCHPKDVHDVLGRIVWKTANRPLPSSVMSWSCRTSCCN